jgi:hypothetical protein
MMQKRIIKTDRYPGPKPYEEDEKDLFFGRSQETESLFESVSVNNVFVLHAESGLGKSSLIAAGLIPRLRTGNYLPVLIRFKNRKAHPMKAVADALHEAMKKKSREEEKEITFTPAEESDAWKLVKKANVLGCTPILIFDQFEEFSYFTSGTRKETVQKLAELTALKLPDYIRKESAGASVPSNWYSQPEVKLIFSIRTDRIGVMEEFAEAIPDTRSRRYELFPLMAEQGEQVIMLPAAMESSGEIIFNSQPFQYEPGLIATILEIVKRKNNTIDTTQLQIICLEIQERVKNKSTAEGTMPVVTEDELGGREGLADLVKNFYVKQLNKIADKEDITPAERLAIRILLEKKLIVQGKKDRLSADSIFEHFRSLEISEDRIKPLLDALLSLRLIRGIDFEESTFYEIAHDTLINPILLEMQNRELEEKLDKEKKQAEDKAKEQAEELRKQRLQTAKEVELRKQAILAEQHAREEERKAKQAEEKARAAEIAARHATESVQRLKMRNERLGLILFIAGIAVLILMFRQNTKLYNRKKEIEILNKKATKGIISIFSSQAEKNYAEGDQLVAHALWDSAYSYNGEDTALLRKLNTLDFVPFCGTFGIQSIQLSGDNSFIGVKYPGTRFMLWHYDEKESQFINLLESKDTRIFQMLPDGRVFLIDTAYNAYVISPPGYKLQERKIITPGKYEDVNWLPKCNLVYLTDTGTLAPYFMTADLQGIVPLNNWISRQAERSKQMQVEVDYDYTVTGIDPDNLLITLNNGNLFYYNLRSSIEPVKISVPADAVYVIDNVNKKLAYNDGSQIKIVALLTGKVTETRIPTGSADEPQSFFCGDSLLLVLRDLPAADNKSFAVYDLTQGKKAFTRQAFRKLGYDAGMNLIGFTDMQGKFILIDVSKEEVIYPFNENQKDLPASSFRFFGNERKIYIKRSDDSLRILSVNRQGEIDTTIAPGPLPEELYGNTFQKVMNQRLRKYTLLFRDSRMNNVQNLLLQFQDYIKAEADKVIND